MPRAGLQSAGGRAKGELTLPVETHMIGIALRRRRATGDRSRAPALHDAGGAAGAIGGGRTPTRGGAAVATNAVAVDAFEAEAGVIGRARKFNHVGIAGQGTRALALSHEDAVFLPAALLGIRLDGVR